MTAVVFVGPTLRPQAVSKYLDATILPPVKQGDVYRAARDKPKAIGIIDGFFEGVPSVWHKEILWAMEQGIPVFGSASMGALRAAELADFGMIGVGSIFEDYHSGVLQDDDEVAVLHSPSELGFMPLSEPMVSIRTTLDHAQKTGVVPQETAVEILRYAKDLHYRRRVWADILDALKELPGMAEFAGWLPKGKIDAKAKDAKAMLVRMSEHLGDPPLPSSEPVRTERTLMWKALCARVDGAAPADVHAVINELRLNPKLYSQLRDRAALALLSREDTSRQDREPDREALVAQMSEHRARAGLTRQADLMAWIKANDLTSDSYEAMLADWARVELSTATRADRMDALLLSELRRTDQYAGLRNRAVKKADQVRLGGNAGPNRLRLLMWYFESCLDQDVPDDLESYAISLGLTGRDAFYDLIETEFLYCDMDTGPDDTSD
ncbi:TfuA-like protein [Ruegeria meonggei]|uniref:TfuA-like protein n=1 Tax=Ruegeria meonggei TaxID=1446476 RepID=A0A1X6Z329_9RHOB|nr:TfuA-like protein [Ruegeria meonggei]SLN38670.1 TfuA-like protein [Ruegeria meonggei]